MSSNGEDIAGKPGQNSSGSIEASAAMGPGTSHSNLPKGPEKTHSYGRVNGMCQPGCPLGP
jgi:hypothetical protein